MPFSWETVGPLINTGLNLAGQFLGGRAQTNALGQAGQINQQATNDAMAQILALYDQGRGDLAPYRNVGQPALNRLQQLAGHPASSIGQTVAPSRTYSNALARPAGQTSISSVMLNSKGQTAAAEAAARSNRLTGIGSTVGGIAGTALGGPLGTVVGSALGGLEAKVLSKFGANNPYKSASSRGIDEVSRRIWGTNTPGIPPEQLTSGIVADVMQGRKSKDQGKQEISGLLNEWVAGMRQNGTPEDVLNSSIQTQKQYLAPLRSIFGQSSLQGVA